MDIKQADYRWCGGPLIEFDADAPCSLCGLPVESASMGGTAICPSCDCGQFRNGRKWEYQDAVNPALRHQHAIEALNTDQPPRGAGR